MGSDRKSEILPSRVVDWPPEAIAAYHERLGMRIEDAREATIEEKRWAAACGRLEWKATRG